MLKINSISVSRSWLFFWATSGVLVATVLGAGLKLLISQTGGSIVTGSSESAETVDPRAIQMANEQIKWAHNESFTRLDSHFAPVLQLFNAARTHDFAESCLSWTSKWLLLKHKLNDSEEHASFIAREFQSQVLDHDELERLLEQCTTSYMQEVSSIDGEMLVRLQLDLASLPTGSTPRFDAAAVNGRYSDALQRAIATSQSDVLATVGREAANFIVSEVVTAALVQLGVSSGILSTGAVSGWATFGAGILVSIAVDYAVQQYTDPAGELSRDLDGRLKRLKDAILEGDENCPGLLERLRDFAQARSIARRDAIQELMVGVSAR